MAKDGHDVIGREIACPRRCASHGMTVDRSVVIFQRLRSRTAGSLRLKGHGSMSEKKRSEHEAKANRGGKHAPAASGKGLKGSLTVLGTAAVLTVYAAGYARTESAARRLENEEAARRQPSTSPEPPPVANASPAVGVLGSTPAESASGSAAPAEVAIASEAEEERPSVTGPASSQPAAPRDSGSRSTEATVTIPTVANDAATGTMPSAPQADSSSTTVAAAPLYKDGSYKGLGWRMRHGQIEATVEIAGGKIVSAAVSMCDMRWPCSDINELVARVPRLQSSNVGMVGGATQSSEAFTSAVFQALIYAKAALQEQTSLQ